MSVTLRLPPQVPVGVTFEWSGQYMAVRACIDGDGDQAKAVGVREGMVLAAMNGKTLTGWSFQELVTAIKSAAGRERVIVFSTLEFLAAQAEAAETAARIAAEAAALQAAAQAALAASLRATSATTSSASKTSIGAAAHSDPWSTPSRRRRVYFQVKSFAESVNLFSFVV